MAWEEFSHSLDPKLTLSFSECPVCARSGRSVILVRDLDQRHVARMALDKRCDIAVSGPADQIALPIARHSTIFNRRRSPVPRRRQRTTITPRERCLLPDALAYPKLLSEPNFSSLVENGQVNPDRIPGTPSDESWLSKT